MTTAALDQPDLDTLARQGHEHIEALRERRQKLSLDSLADEKAAAEMATIEGEIAQAESQLRRIELARGEHARREAEAAEQAERERKAAAWREFEPLRAAMLAEAEKLQKELRAVAQRLPKIAGLKDERDAALERAGVEINRQALRQIRPEGGLLYELRAAGSERLAPFLLFRCATQARVRRVTRADKA